MQSLSKVPETRFWHSTTISISMMGSPVSVISLCAEAADYACSAGRKWRLPAPATTGPCGKSASTDHIYPIEQFESQTTEDLTLASYLLEIFIDWISFKASVFVFCNNIISALTILFYTGNFSTDSFPQLASALSPAR